jgi:hypothetical protein
MRRFSIRETMSVILVCAVGLAALRNANEFWAGVVVLATMAVLGTALLGVIHRRGTGRAWWLGFGIFAGGYLVLALGPWFSDHIQPTLATTLLLDYVHLKVTSEPVPRFSALRMLRDRRQTLAEALASSKKMVRNVNDPGVKRIQRELDSLDIQITQIQGFPASLFAIAPTEGAAPAAPLSGWQIALPGAANHDQFLRIGHCLSALLAGLGGAFISVQLFASRDSSEGVRR